MEKANRTLLVGCVLAMLVAPLLCRAQKVYQGFDKNEYPGDAAMRQLRASFQFTGYWLNNPPGQEHNSWRGKRALLRRQGFGFLVLFNGRLQRDLIGQDAAALGGEDGRAAVNAALADGFPRQVRIFLDLEEGGRLLREQSDYVLAWIDAVRLRGARAGVYCSAIEVPDGEGRISTASYLERLETERRSSGQIKRSLAPLVFWVANDQCPPSPGCALRPLAPADGAALSERGNIVAWQYAQSPRRSGISARCPLNTAADGNCHAPGLADSAAVFVDLNTATSPNPSEAK